MQKLVKYCAYIFPCSEIAMMHLGTSCSNDSIKREEENEKTLRKCLDVMTYWKLCGLSSFITWFRGTPVSAQRAKTHRPFSTVSNEHWRQEIIQIAFSRVLIIPTISSGRMN